MSPTQPGGLDVPYKIDQDHDPDRRGTVPPGTVSGSYPLFPLLACFLVLSLALGGLSNGVHHDDDLTHFLMARWSAWFPAYLLHVWGRPGLTVPLAAVSWIGEPETAWHLARAVSALVTAGAAFTAARLAGRLGASRPWLVALACYAQPYNMMLSYTTLAENFASLYLILGIYLLHRRKPAVASLVFSLALVTRPETAVLLPFWGMGLLRLTTRWRTRLWAGLLVLWAPIVQNVGHRLVFEQWPIQFFTQPHGSTAYLPTGSLAFLPNAFLAVSAPLLALAVLGAVGLARREAILVPLMAGAYFVTHCLIKALGLYASGGHARFMVALAPLIAVMAAAGADPLTLDARRRRGLVRFWTTVAAVFLAGWMACEVELRAGRLAVLGGAGINAVRAFVTVLTAAVAVCFLCRTRWRAGPLHVCLLALLSICWAVQWIIVVKPLRLRADQHTVRQVVAWIDQHEDLASAPLFAANPWFAYFLDLIEDPRAYKGQALLASMPVGTLFVWDSTYSPNQFHRLPIADYLHNDAYQRLQWFPDGPRGGVTLVVFRKLNATAIPRDPRKPYPPALIGPRAAVRGVYYLRGGAGRTGAVKSATGG